MKYYKGLSKAQFEVLTQIAFGGESYYHGGKTIDKLLKMGLIEKSANGLFLVKEIIR